MDLLFESIGLTSNRQFKAAADEMEREAAERAAAIQAHLSAYGAATSSYWGSVNVAINRASGEMETASREIIRFCSEISESTKNMLNPFLDSADEARSALLDIFLQGKPVAEADTIEISRYIREMADTAVDQLRRMQDAALENLAFLYGEEAMDFQRRITEATRFYDDRLAEIDREGRALADSIRFKQLVTSEEEQMLARRVAAGEEAAQSTLSTLDAESRARVEALAEALAAERDYINGVSAERDTLMQAREQEIQRLVELHRDTLDPAFLESWETTRESYQGMAAETQAGTDAMLQSITENMTAGQVVTLDALNTMHSNLEDFTAKGIGVLVDDAAERESILRTRDSDLIALDIETGQRREALLAAQYDEAKRLQNEHYADIERLTAERYADEIAASLAHSWDLAIENDKAREEELRRLEDALNEELRVLDAYHREAGTINSEAHINRATELEQAYERDRSATETHYRQIEDEISASHSRQVDQFRQNTLEEMGLATDRFDGFLDRSREFNEQQYSEMGAGAEKTTEAMAEGWSRGIDNSLSEMVRSWVFANEEANRAVLDYWQISSPSQVAHDQGENIGTSWGLGIESTTPEVIGTVDTMMSNIVSAIESASSNVQKAFKDIFSNSVMTETQKFAADFTKAITTAMDNATRAIRNASNPIITLFRTLYSNIMSETTRFSNDMQRAITDMMDAVHRIVQNAVNPIVNEFKRLFAEVMVEANNFRTAFTTEIRETFNDITKPGGILATFSTNFSAGISSALTAAATVVSNSSGINDAFRGLFNTVIGTTETFANRLVSGIRSAVSQSASILSALPDAPTINVPSATNISIPRLKSGMPFVPHDFYGPVYLDYGEAVLTERQNREYSEGGGSGSSEEQKMTNVLLKQAIGILTAISDKDTSVYLGDREVANSAKRGARQQGFPIYPDGDNFALNF
jgi:hypothetical protein